MRVVTARYANRLGIVGSGAVPVQMSVGVPDWPLGFTVAATLLEAAPAPWTVRMADADEFRRVYLAKLERLGVARLRQALHAICERTGKDALALLCFENVASGATCHRRIFAEWWERETGEVVEELPDTVRSEGTRQLGLPFGGGHGAA